MSPRDLREAAPSLAALDALLMVHAEGPRRWSAPPGPREIRGPTPPGSPPPGRRGDGGGAILIGLAREWGLACTSCTSPRAETLELIAAARADGVRITAETCPHYLDFAAEEIPDGATEYKCAPPIREARHREGLWEALARDRLDAVRERPFPGAAGDEAARGGRLLPAWGGIASLQLGFPRSGPARGRGDTLRSGWPRGCAPGPRVWPASTGRRARSRRATTPTWSSGIRRRSSWWTTSMLHHRHPITP